MKELVLFLTVSLTSLFIGIIVPIFASSPHIKKEPAGEATKITDMYKLYDDYTRGIYVYEFTDPRTNKRYLITRADHGVSTIEAPLPAPAVEK